MKDITEISQGMDRQALKFIRALKLLSDDVLDEVLAECLVSRRQVGKMKFHLSITADHYELHDPITKMLALVHVNESKITAILSEREHRS